MEHYKNNLKKYSYELKEKSIILKLLEIGRCHSLTEVREIVSECKWKKQLNADVYNFNSQEIKNNCEIFYSEILINTSVKIIEILKNDNLYDIILEGDIDKNIFTFGISIYVNNKGETVKIGNIINLNKNVISIKSDLNNFELDLIIDNSIIAELKINACQIYNKGISIFLPVIKLNDGNWAYDCIIDKKTYENDNKLCFNLLDDLNPANACGIVSIGLLGAFIGKITYDTFQEKKKENNSEDKKILLNILNKVKKMNIKKKTQFSDSSDDNLSDSSDGKLSENSDDDESESEKTYEILSNKKIENTCEEFNTDNISNDSDKKNIQNDKEYIDEVKKEILNRNDINNDLDLLKKSIQEIEKSPEMNHVLLNLQNLENTLEKNIETDLRKFENEYNKIKIDDSISFENEFLKSNIHFKNNILKQYSEEKDKINEAENYINLLNKA